MSFLGPIGTYVYSLAPLSIPFLNEEDRVYRLSSKRFWMRTDRTGYVLRIHTHHTLPIKTIHIFISKFIADMHERFDDLSTKICLLYNRVFFHLYNYPVYFVSPCQSSTKTVNLETGGGGGWWGGGGGGWGVFRLHNHHASMEGRPRSQGHKRFESFLNSHRLP